MVAVRLAEILKVLEFVVVVVGVAASHSDLGIQTHGKLGFADGFVAVFGCQFTAHPPPILQVYF